MSDRERDRRRSRSRDRADRDRRDDRDRERDRSRRDHSDRDHRERDRERSDKDRDRDRDTRRRSRSRSRDRDRYRDRDSSRRDDYDRRREDRRGDERDGGRDRDRDRERGGRDVPPPVPPLDREREREREREGERPPGPKQIDRSQYNDEIDVGPPEGTGAGKGEGGKEGEGKKPPVQPNFGLSGALAKASLEVNGVVLKFTEPPEARKPSERWLLYVFKNEDLVGEPLHVHRNSCYLFGRDRRIADIPTDHPSCSSQHAVLQFRAVEKIGEDGMDYTVVRPYLLDLESTNGSFINNERVEPSRYYELLEKDVIRLGNSTRDYVLLRAKE